MRKEDDVVRDYRSIELWEDVEPDEWYDWRWQLKNRITTVEQLTKVIPLSNEEQKG